MCMYKRVTVSSDRIRQNKREIKVVQSEKRYVICHYTRHDMHVDKCIHFLLSLLKEESLIFSSECKFVWSFFRLVYERKTDNRL
jgi:hypothetical protein